MELRTQKLFNYLATEHGVMLLENELFEVERICQEIKDKWISVEDRLPENHSGVLTSDGGNISEMYFNNGRFTMPYTNQYDEDGWINVITHWQHLPEPPKEQE